MYRRARLSRTESVGGSMNRRATDVEYLKAADAARILHVSPKTVSRWAKEGRVPHIVTLGGHRRFPRAEIEELARKLRGQS